MENDLLGNILNNIVLEKVVRDKIVMQQKEQREEEARLRREEARDELDEFDDEETREIMRKMKNERLRMNEEVPENHREETRTVGEYREVSMYPLRLSRLSSSSTSPNSNLQLFTSSTRISRDARSWTSI
jgi:hypothetical protein